MARRSDHTREELRALILATTRTRIAKDGLRAVSARNIAADIGYTAGTIYNLFDDLDDLIWHANGDTLDALFRTLTKSAGPTTPKDALRKLAGDFLDFVRTHPKEWAAVLEFSAQTQTSPPVWYGQKSERLLALADKALVDISKDASPLVRARHVQVLWSALYGISALQDRSARPVDDAKALVDLLVDTYTAGLQSKYE